SSGCRLEGAGSGVAGFAGTSVAAVVTLGATAGVIRSIKGDTTSVTADAHSCQVDCLVSSAQPTPSAIKMTTYARSMTLPPPPPRGGQILSPAKNSPAA